MRWLISTTMAVCLVLSACGDTTTTTTSAAATTTQLAPTTQPATTTPQTTVPATTAPPQPVGCITFNDLTLATQYLSSLSFMSDGVPVDVGDFHSAGTAYANHTTVGDLLNAGGDGHEMEINNVTLIFRLPGSPSGWSVQFGEYGGDVNLAVNGDNLMVDTDNFEDWNGLQFGGAEVVASGGLGSPGGTLLLRGPDIEELVIGGQELFIDNLCPIG